MTTDRYNANTTSIHDPKNIFEFMTISKIIIPSNRLSKMFAMIFVVFATLACVNELKPEGGWSSPQVSDDMIFVGNRDGYLVRFDPNSKTLDTSWIYPTGDGIGAIYSDPIMFDGNVYGTGYKCNQYSGDRCEGEVFGVRIIDGRSIWGQGGLELKTKLVGNVGFSGDTIFVGTSAIGDEEDGADGYLYAIDASPDASSIVRWRIPLDGASSSGVAIDGSTAFISTMTGTVYAIDISNVENRLTPDTRIKWTFQAEGALAGPILAVDGSLYFGDFANNAYKLNNLTRVSSSNNSNVEAGNGEWKFDAGAWVWAKPVIEGDTVYISALDGAVFAIDDSSGVEKWSASLDGQIVASPTLFDRKRGDTRERALAVPSGESNVWVISVIDGRELGVFVTDEKIKSTPLIYNNQLFVHTLNGDLKWFSVDDTTQRGCVELKSGARCD